MAKNIEYEDEEDMPQDLSNEDELDFEDEKPAKKEARASPLPVKPNVQASDPKAAQAVKQEEMTPEMQAQMLIQTIIAKIEELDARLTRIESELYRQR